MKRSISKLLNIRIALVVICVNVLIGVFFYSFAARLAENEFQKNIESQTKHLSDTFTQQLWLFDLSSAEQLIDLTLDAYEIKGLRLLDHEKNILIEKGIFDKESMEYLQKELRFKGENLVGYLELAFVDTSWVKHKKDLLIASFGMVGATILLTFLMVSFLLNRHLTQPLNDLQQDMDRLADGQFKSSELVPKTLEIQSIIDVFNRMAGSLAQREDQRNQAEVERHELESQLLQKYKMEAVGTMAGGIAHNFNNNLSIILGNVELSQLKANNPEIKGLLSNAKIAVMRSRDLVSQIMTYSRTGGHAKAPLQLPIIIDETLKLLGVTIPSTIQLNQTLSPESYHTTINADASQIQEILLNLYGNAVHAMDEEGELNIILDVVELTNKDLPDLNQNKPGSYAKISIQDSGCGMSAEKSLIPSLPPKSCMKGQVWDCPQFKELSTNMMV